MMCRMIEDLDHREAGDACKSESARKAKAACVGQAPTVFRRSIVKQLTAASRCPRYPRRYAGRLSPPGGPMKTRRLAFWWFRFVVSGRFLGTFLKRPRA